MTETRHTRPAPLELRDGKFFRGSVLVPTEFGNLEQIRLMNERLQEIRDAETKGILVEPDITVTIEATIKFPCICGRNIWIHADPDDEDDMDCFISLNKSCQCGKKWEVVKDDDGDLRVKQQPK